jgi:hypothetical protein
MDDKEEKKGFWQSWMIIAVLAILAIMVFIFNPYMISKQNENISIGNGTKDNGTNVEGNTNVTDNSIVPMDNDTFFKTMVEVNSRTIFENLDCISRAGKTKNFSETERCGKFLSDNANLFLRHLNGYNVSTYLQETLGEYKNALSYYNIGGTKLEIGARSRNLSQMGDAIKYIQNGTIYINKVADVLYGNETFNVTNMTSNNSSTYPKITGAV